MIATLPNLPVATEVLDEHLRQFQLAGLITAFCSDGQGIVRRMTPHYHGILTLLASAPTLAQSPLTLNTPAVYSVDNWDSDQLAGYVGAELSISPKALLNSYANLWAVMEKLRDTGTDHFVRCALWYHENHARDLHCTIKFVVDLYCHGYFASRQVFIEVIRRFSQFYVSGADLSFLSGSKIRDLPKINEELSRIRRQFPPASMDQYEDILKCVIDLAQDLASDARNATNADAWLVGIAKFAGPALLLALEHHGAAKERTGVVTRAMLSAIEEMSADLGAVAGRFHFLKLENLPPRWDFSPNLNLVTEYRSSLPESEWLDRLVDDRLVMPLQLKELLATMETKQFDDSTLPSQFRFNTARLATPLCVAIGLQPTRVRSVDFPNAVLGVTMAHFAQQSGNRPTVSEVRRRLIEYELTELIASVTEPAEADGHLLGERVGRFLTLYPWHALPIYISATAGSVQYPGEVARRLLRDALLLNPLYIDAWRALAKLGEEDGSQADAAVLRSMADAVKALLEGPR